MSDITNSATQARDALREVVRYLIETVQDSKQTGEQRLGAARLVVDVTRALNDCEAMLANQKDAESE